MPKLPPPSPFCKHLCTKKTFFLDAPPRDEEELLEASGACWCAQTQQAVGPDTEIVHPADCRDGRPCFEPFL